MPLGTEKVQNDGYIRVKVAEPSVWVFKHRLLWEEANGPIPEGHMVTFIDGDKSNFHLENLRLSTRSGRKRPDNQGLPIGTERDHCGYIKVKIAEPNVWKFKHQLLWEEAHGPIPEGHIVYFIDGDRSNCRLANLRLGTWHDVQISRCVRAPRAVKYQIGDEKINSLGFIAVKIGENKWKPKHHLIWEEANGPLPAGKRWRLIFIDGNRLNCTLENIAFDGAPLGSETLESLTGGRKYLKVKVAEPDVWVFKHRYVWELANGPIPEGHMIQFADKNTLNCELENLMLVSNKEAGYLSAKNLYFEDSELNKTSVNIAKISLALNESQKKIG